MFATALHPDGWFGGFADRMLATELPDLPANRRGDTVVFCCRRVASLPTPLRIGLTCVAGATSAAGRAVDRDRVDRFLRGTTLPVLGELARLVRSLAIVYVWERWPDSSPTGDPGPAAAVSS